MKKKILFSLCFDSFSSFLEDGFCSSEKKIGGLTEIVGKNGLEMWKRRLLRG